MPKVVELLFGTDISQKIANTNLLIVGVGGIGCELLKSLSKSGFKKFTILDFDHIQQTNLNRQFYFRKIHIGQSKAQVGKMCLEAIDPSMKINAICDSIFSAKYDSAFFEEFDIIISALDNNAARRHLSEMAIKVGKPIVDAGTQGFFGQARSIKRFFNDCHNCVPAKQEESFAVCTIRNSPQRPVHCIAYAKSLYDEIFGPSSSKPILQEVNTKTLVNGDLSDEEILEKAKVLFKVLFYQKISNKLERDQSGGSCSIYPISFEQAANLKQIVVNPSTTFNQLKFKKQSTSEFKQQKLLSISQYANMFVQSFFNIVKYQKRHIGTLKFQKDDEYCMRFVYAVTTIRTYNFMNSKSTFNKHQYLTFFDCKDMAGKIVAAISSTNSIAAAIETSDLIRIIQGKIQSLRFITFKSTTNPKIQSLRHGQPLLDCPVCSKRCVYLKLFCDFSKITYEQLERYLQNNFRFGRQPQVHNNKNLKYFLNFHGQQQNQPTNFKLEDFNQIIRTHETTAPHGCFELKYYSDLSIPINMNVNVVNKPGEQGIKPASGSQRDPNAKNILEYLRKTKEQNQYLQENQYSINGFV